MALPASSGQCDVLAIKMWSCPENQGAGTTAWEESQEPVFRRSGFGVSTPDKGSSVALAPMWWCCPLVAVGTWWVLALPSPLRSWTLPPYPQHSR